MGIVYVNLAEILLELTLGPISTRSHESTFAGKVPFSLSGSHVTVHAKTNHKSANLIWRYRAK